MKKAFYVYNSFTDQAFCGNPAGVVPDADDLSTEQMQLIARQLNLVETVFILKDTDPGVACRLRYFMPEGELPIAGHPTIAAWAYLKDSQVSDNQNFKQTTGAGPIQVSLQDNKIYATQKTPTIRELKPFDWQAAAKLFKISEDDILKNYPAAVVDAGLGHLIFGLKSLDALMRMQFVPEELAQLCSALGARECQFYSLETMSSGFTAYTRNLCPRYGLEDPACGNGNAALGAYFATFIETGKDNSNFRFEQGHKVHMPAAIDVKVHSQNSTIQSVMIGGTAKRMVEGYVETR